MATSERMGDGAREWNERVSVCRDHTAEIVDGPCVICRLNDLEAAARNVSERKAAYFDGDDADEPLIAWADACDELAAMLAARSQP